MTWFGRFRRRAALDRDLDRELQDHLERRTQALIAAGQTPAQARRQAVIESGGAEQVKEAVRDVRGTRWAHDFVQDVRFGTRSLRKQPRSARRGGAVDGPRHRRQHRDLLARRRRAAARAAGASAAGELVQPRGRQLDQPDLGGGAATLGRPIRRRAGLVRGAPRPLERRRDRIRSTR